MKNLFKRKTRQLKSDMIVNRMKEIINRVENRKEKQNIFILQIKTLGRWVLSLFKKNKEINNKFKSNDHKLNGELEIVGRIRNELENTIGRLIVLKHELEYGLTEEQRKKINSNHYKIIERFKELIEYNPNLK